MASWAECLSCWTSGDVLVCEVIVVADPTAEKWAGGVHGSHCLSTAELYGKAICRRR